MMKLILENGSIGQEVKRVQHILKTSVDGKFGPKTELAVKQYQKKNVLTRPCGPGIMLETVILG